MTPKRIAYSIPPDGGGHLSRNQPILEALGQQHQVDIYTNGKSYQAYSQWFAGHPRIRVLEAPAIIAKFKHGSMDLWAMMRYNFSTVMGSSKHIKKLSTKLLNNHYHFAISDCEPFMSRAAERVAKTTDLLTIHINHHPILHYGNVGQPPLSRLLQKACALFLKSLMPSASHIYLNSFYPPRQPLPSHIEFIGPVLRDYLFQCPVSDQGHIVVYLKDSIADRLYPILQKITNYRFIVYASHPDILSPSPHIILREQTRENSFLDTIASAHAIIGVAGIDMPSEALYLQKPMLAIAERFQFEQYVNGYELERMGGGEWLVSHKLTLGRVLAFLKAVPAARPDRIKSQRAGIEPGNKRIMAALNSLLTTSDRIR